MQGGGEAVSEGSRRSELVGVTGSPRICKGEWQGGGDTGPHRRGHTSSCRSQACWLGSLGKARAVQAGVPHRCGAGGAGAEGHVVPGGGPDCSGWTQVARQAHCPGHQSFSLEPGWPPPAGYSTGISREVLGS